MVLCEKGDLKFNLVWESSVIKYLSLFYYGSHQDLSHTVQIFLRIVICRFLFLTGTQKSVSLKHALKQFSMISHWETVVKIKATGICYICRFFIQANCLGLGQFLFCMSVLADFNLKWRQVDPKNQANLKINPLFHSAWCASLPFVKCKPFLT